MAALRDVREELLKAREQIEAGFPEAALHEINQALEDLSPATLLTTTQAKDLLGLGSVNTLKLLIKKEGIPVVMHGSRMMIPLSEVETLQAGAPLRGLQASSRLHNESSKLGDTGGDEEREDRGDIQRGSFPWS